MQALLDRLAALENRSKPTVPSLKKGILQYALRQTSDFDKYIALEKIETLKIVSKDLKDKKCDYYASTHAALLERINKPTNVFKDYVLSLLGGRDYEKIIESVSRLTSPLKTKNHLLRNRATVLSLHSCSNHLPFMVFSSRVKAHQLPLVPMFHT